MGRWNCNIHGAYITNIVQGCFRPNTTIYVFRDGNPVEEIYYGPASDMPSLQKYRVVDIQYDNFYYIFSIEVK